MIFYDNLIYFKKDIKIPSSANENFLITKHWDYSQKIIFNIDTVNIENLYIIIQSYLWNSEIRCLKLYTFAKRKEEDKQIILSYSNVFKIKKMNLFYFSIWWEDVSNYDKKYINEGDIYGIIVVFSPESLNNFCKKKKIDINEIYDNLSPKYPWNDNILTLINLFK